LNEWAAQRRVAAERYDQALACLGKVRTPGRNNFGGHVFHQYTVRVPQRDVIQKKLADQGVSTMVYYPVPIHLQPIYSGLGYRPGSFPITEQACSEVLSLPMFPELTEIQIEYVVSSLRSALEEVA
jgi:dTDP-4-amino-4,6-dideoxygalactose transaminase